MRRHAEPPSSVRDRCSGRARLGWSRCRRGPVGAGRQVRWARTERVPEESSSEHKLITALDEDGVVRSFCDMLLVDNWTKSLYGCAGMEGELRVGIAGTGFIGGGHARAGRVSGARPVGVASATPANAEAAASALGADRAYASADELIADPAIDVVHICTPNHLHAPLAEAALAAGKHVICEKPLAIDAASAAGLAAAADSAGLQAAVPFVYRYYPTVREARELVRSGATGAVRLLHGSYLQDWLLRPDDDNWRVDPALGGASRAFADIGSHWCDLAEFLSGHRITRLSARTFTAVPERVRSGGRKAFEAAAGDAGELRPVETEGAAVVQFETDAGAIGSVVISQDSAGRKHRLSVELGGALAALAFSPEPPVEAWPC